MKIQKTTQVNFQAKFLKSDSLEQVVNYAIERGKFDKLNTARKNIDNTHFSTRLKVDIGDDDGRPFVRFTRYNLKPNAPIDYTMDDFRQEKTTVFKSSVKMNPLKFAFEKIIKLGNDAPHNNMYKKVVKDKR